MPARVKNHAHSLVMFVMFFTWADSFLRKSASSFPPLSLLHLLAAAIDSINTVSFLRLLRLAIQLNQGISSVGISKLRGTYFNVGAFPAVRRLVYED